MPTPDATRRGRAPDPLPLQELVDAADALLEHQPDGAILRVTGDPPKLETLPLGGCHPLDVLLGLTAPTSWSGIGLHTRGRGYDVDDPRNGPPLTRRTSFADEVRAAVPVSVTLLIDRTGRGDGVLRDGSTVRRLPGLPEGAVGDSCRRALGLPTAAPPDSTVRLWLHVWLDRVVEAAGSTRRRSRVSWDTVARLHPTGKGLPAAPTAPEVQEATREWADAWPWSRLRLDPECVDHGRPPLERAVTHWMDDGMFARWVLGEMIDVRLLAQSAARLLDDHVLAQLATSFALCGFPLPTEEVRP
ncbi:MAG TPA: hypothetical protein VK611_26315 [Acidimicrobiales bacterium]|nr:hypothetical protein [Acidimicrobiales bacterium]